MKGEFVPTYSSNLSNITKSAVFLMLLLVLPLSAWAQMFSIGNDNSPRNVPLFGLYLAYEPMTVTYKGDESITQSGIFAFDGPVLRVGYQSTSLDLSLAAGGEITGLNEVSYFDVGGNISVPLSLYRTAKFAVRVPVQIASRYTTITNSRLLERFKFGSLTVGAGLKLFTRPLEDFRIQAGVIPAYGFSFASGGIFGGSLGSVDVGGRFFLDHLFNDIGLSIGYKYRIRNYNVDEEFYDYLMKAHSIQLGVTF